MISLCGYNILTLFFPFYSSYYLSLFFFSIGYNDNYDQSFQLKRWTLLGIVMFFKKLAVYFQLHVNWSCYNVKLEGCAWETIYI